MTWVVFELATRPDLLKTLREELMLVTKDGEKTGETELNMESLSNASHTDSFIRETMRMKGDLLSTVRMTTQDVELGGVTIPKGMTNLCHRTTNLIISY
jgi:cytochrome P450